MQFARERVLVRRISRLYSANSHGDYALQSIQRLARGELEIAGEATAMEQSIRSKFLYKYTPSIDHTIDTRAAKLLCALANDAKHSDDWRRSGALLASKHADANRRKVFAAQIRL
jgi:hypothetical protein